MFFFLIFFVLGLCFGFAVRLPWALLAFLIPLALAAAATDRSAVSIVIGLVVTGIGIFAGMVLSARVEQHERRERERTA